MPDLDPPRPRYRLLVMPWRHTDPWSRFLGCFCLFAVLYELVMFVFGAPSMATYVMLAALMVIGIMHMVINCRDIRRFKRTSETLRIWSQVLDGKIRFEDLPPALQEEIAVQRAHVYTNRTGEAP